MSASRDPRALERLLAETGWIRSLARGLCADASAADDLVQDAWVAALEHPPRDERAAPTWFARVIGNLHRERHRRLGARDAREREVARGEALASASDVVERAEIGRRLVENVLALDEPYRSTVLSRYFDEWSAEEIARRDGVPSSTVRTRLQRGLAQLRARLEREEGRTWMSSLVLLARASSPTVPTAAPPAATVAAASTTGAIGELHLAGVFAMSSLVKIGIGLSLVVATAWFAWPEPTPPAETAAAAPRAAERREIESERARAPEPERTAVAAPPVKTAPSSPSITAAAPELAGELTAEEIAKLETPSPIGSIEGIVFNGRTPLAKGAVSCWASWDPLPEKPREPRAPIERDARSESLQRTELDAHGEFRFRALRFGQYRVGVDTGDGPRMEVLVDLQDKPGRRVVIVLGTATVRGHVYDDEGKPLVGAWVSLSLDASRKGSKGFFTGRRSDARGAYSIDDLPAGPYWFALRADGRNEGFNSDLTQRLPLLHLGEQRTFDVGEPRRAAMWSGTVRTRGGEFVAGPTSLWIDDQKSVAHFEVPYDEEGRFRVRLRPGDYSVRVATRSHWPPELVAAPIKIDRKDLERDVVIPGTRLQGVVLDARTQEPWPSTAPSVVISIHIEGADYPSAFTRTTVGADGRFVIDGIAGGSWLLDARFASPAKYGNSAAAAEPALFGVRFTVLDSDLAVPLRLALEPR